MCSIAAAGLAISAASTAATIYQQQQVAKANDSAQSAAAQTSAAARRAELTRQDELRAERQAVADQNLAETGAAGTADRLADATTSREATAAEAPTTAPQIFTTGSPVVGNAITAQVAKGLNEARGRLAARARLSAYDDVAADEARMRTLAGSAFEALKSMSSGSMGAYQGEAQQPVTPAQASPLPQIGIIAGNAIAANPNTIRSWATGTTRPTDQLAAHLTDRMGAVWGTGG
jgi:hypothetical protein